MRPYLETSFPRPGVNPRRLMLPNYIPHYGDGSNNMVAGGYNALVVDKFGENQISYVHTYCTGNFRASRAQYSTVIESIFGITNDAFEIQAPTAVAASINLYNLAYNIPPNKFCMLKVWYCVSVTSVALSVFKLIFADGSEKTFQEAVNEQRIQPMVLINSRVTDSSSYPFATPQNVYNGGTTDTKSYSSIFIGFVTIQALRGYKFTSSKAISGSGQGASFKFCSAFEGLKLIT